MITISTLSNGCRVDVSGSKFDVFPAKIEKDTWTLAMHPEEELTNEKVVSWPGEYDFGGISVRAVGQEDGKQVSYACNAEHVNMAFIGSPVLSWSDNDVEKMGDIDVLVISADNAKKVQDAVEAIDPRMVVLLETDEGDLAGCLKAFGKNDAISVKDVKIKKSGLPQGSREVVVLG
ncbi:MAG: hypothetical protein ABL890_03700 [Candidatus Peribacteraceae bacterium]